MQAGQQRSVAARRRGRGFQQVGPAAAGGGHDDALHGVETPVAHDLPRIGGEAAQVDIEQVEQPDASRCRSQSDDRPRDDAALPEPGEHGVEQPSGTRGRAAHPPPLSRHDLERDDVVHLRAVAEPAAADAADAERSADGQVLIVSQRRRDQPARERALEQRAPGRPRIHVGARSADVMHAGQSGHVDHDARVDLRLTIGRVALPAGRDADPMPPREADQPDHVIDRTRLQHSQRTALHDVTEIIRSGPPSGVVDAQRAIEGGKPAPETPGPFPGPRPRPSREVKSDDERGRRRRLSQESTSRDRAHKP